MWIILLYIEIFGDIEKKQMSRRSDTQMATEEHKRLSDIVKKTHALLRAECQQYGAETAWQRHVSRNDVLQVRFKPRFLKFFKFQRNIFIVVHFFYFNN